MEFGPVPIAIVGTLKKVTYVDTCDTSVEMWENSNVMFVANVSPEEISAKFIC